MQQRVKHSICTFVCDMIVAKASDLTERDARDLMKMFHQVDARESDCAAHVRDALRDNGLGED